MSSRRTSAVVLVDLDGTLVDTAPDMGAALNLLLKENNRPALDQSTIRPSVSNGARALVRLGFGSHLVHASEKSLVNRFLEIYSRHVCRGSHIMPGFDAVLTTLSDRAVPWGIVTNKPGWLTTPLLKALGLSTRAAIVVAGDTVAKRKPDPMPLVHATEQLGIEPGDCLYLGDSERDVEAGRTAGMTTIVALFGYIPADTDPKTWNADGMIGEPGELLDWV